LSSLLPHSLAELLIRRPRAPAGESPELIAGSLAEITILFADIVAFTKFTEGASAQVMMGVLNDISARLPGNGGPDPRRGDTMDDAYLASVDLSDLVANHTLDAAAMALDLSEALGRFNGRSRYKLKVRISLDPGAAGPGRARKGKPSHDL
jgi:hypothetical protein